MNWQARRTFSWAAGLWLAAAGQAHATGCITTANVPVPNPTIQSAVNLATGTTLTGDYCIKVDTGTYIETVVVQDIITNGFRIIISTVGAGGVTTVSPPSNAGFLINNDSVSIVGLTVSPVATVPYGIVISSKYAALTDLSISGGANITSAGVQVSSLTSGANISNVNIAVGAGAKGLDLGGSNHVVSHSTVTATSNVSLYMDGATLNFIDNSFFSNNTGYGGVLSSNASNNTISQSSITTNNSANYALQLIGAPSNTITQSAVYNPAGYALRLESGSNGTLVTQSTMTSGASGYAGLYMDGVLSSTVTQSFIFNANGHGAYVSNSSLNVFSQNTIMSNSVDKALYLFSSSHNVVAQSFISNPAGYGALIDIGSDFNAISQTTITSNSSTFIALMIGASASNTVTKCTIANPSGFSLYLASATATSISLSTMTSGAAAYGALRAAGSSGVAVSGSFLYGNPALVVDGSTVSLNGGLFSGSSALALSSGTVTALSALNIRGDVTAGGGVFFAGNFNHNVGGNLNFAAGTFASQSSTITLDGSQNIPPLAFQAVSMSGNSFNGLKVNVSSVVFISSFTANVLSDTFSGSTMAFASGPAFTVADLQILGGPAPIRLRADSGAFWKLNVLAKSGVFNAIISESDAGGGLTVQANEGTSVDAGGNINWNFKPFLAVMLPGEIYTNGIGKTGSATLRTAGAGFTVQVRAFSASLNTVAGANFPVVLNLTDPYGTPASTQTLVGGTTNFNVTLFSAEPSLRLTTFTAASFSAFVAALATAAVQTSSFVRLQTLLPGEIAAPGSPSGKLGTPNIQVRGVAIPSVKVRATDPYFNLVAANDTVAFVGQSAVTFPGPAVLSSGTAVFANNVTVNSTGSFVLTANDATNGAIAQGVSVLFNVALPSVSSPTVSLSIANSTVASLGGGLNGTAADPSAVSTVTVTLRDIFTGNYFDWVARSFSSLSPVSTQAALSPPISANANWFVALEDGLLSDSHRYLVDMRVFNPSGLMTQASGMFTFNAGNLVFGANDGKGTAAAAPALASGCEPVIATITFTVGGGGIGPGGAVALRVPGGWNAPLGLSGANPPPQGYVNIVSTSAAMASAAVFFNPPNFSSVTLGNGWVLMMPTAANPFKPGENIVFTYNSYPAFGSQGLGPQVFDLRTQGGGSGALVSLSSPPVITLTAGTTSYIAFEDYNPIFLGPLQTSPTMHLRLTDICGNPKPAPGVLTSTLTAGNFNGTGFILDASAQFYSAGGAAVSVISFPAGSMLSSGFYYRTSAMSAGAGNEFIRAVADLPGPSGSNFSEASRYVSLLAQNLGINNVSLDTGSGFNIHFNTNIDSSWEVVISTDPVNFYPAVYRSFGFGGAGQTQNIFWNAVNQQTTPPQSVPPGDYKVRIAAGGGSAVDSSLLIRILLSPSIHGNLGVSGAGSLVSASGPGSSYGNYTQASSTGYFQIFGLKDQVRYNIFASTSLLTAEGRYVPLSTAAYNVLATNAGGDAGVLVFPQNSFVRIKVTIPAPAFRDITGGVFAHNADYSATAFGSLHYFAGSVDSDNGAQNFGQTASTWTVLALPPGTYDLEINLPDLQISTRIAGNVLTGGGALDVALVLTKKSNAYGVVALPGATTFGSWVSLEALKQGDNRPTVFGGAFIPGGVAQTSATYSLFGLDPGTWTFSAKSFGFVSSSGAVVVSSNSDVGDLSGIGGLNLNLGLGVAINGTIAVAGDSTRVSQCFNFGGAFNKACSAGTYDLAIQAYNPKTLSFVSTQVRLTADAVSASSPFAITGLEPGTYFLRSFLKGFDMSPPGDQEVIVTAAGGSAALTLAANDARLSLDIKIPPLPGGACRSQSDFQSVGIMLMGPEIMPMALSDITALPGAAQSYFCSSMTVLSPPMGTGFYRFAAMYGKTGARQTKDIPLVNHSTASFTMDLSGSTFTVSGSATFSGNVNFSQGANFAVTVSSIIGILNNAPTTSYCLLSSSNPVTVSALHLELVPVDRQGSQNPGPFVTAANTSGACGAIALSPGSVAGGVMPSVIGYVAAINPDGGFSFNNVAPGTYILRNISDLDLNPFNGREISDFSTTLQVSGNTAGVAVKLSQGVQVQGSVFLPQGVSLSRPVEVIMYDSRGSILNSLTVSFQNSNSASYTFESVGDGRYSLSARDAGYPKAYVAKPLAVAVAGASLSRQDITLSPGGTIKAAIAVQQSLADGSRQFTLLGRENSNLLPHGFSVDAAANPWIQGGFFFARSDNCGPDGCRGVNLDANGQVLIENVLPGTYDVEFNAPYDAAAMSQGGMSLVSAVKSGVTVAEGQTVDLGVVQLLAGLTLSGRVTDVATSSPIANVPIGAKPAVKVAGQSNGRQGDLRVTTDRDGKYSLIGLDPTVRFYDIYAAARDSSQQGDIQAPYEQKIAASVDIIGTTTLNFALTQATFSISGQVAGITGAPLQAAFSQGQGPGPGAIIFLQKNNVIPTANPVADIVFITDPYGNFTIPSLTPGTYRLIATALGFASQNRLVTITNAALNLGVITLNSGATLSGNLSKPDGSAPSEDEIHLIIGATAGLSDLLFGSLTRDTATRSITGYTLSGFSANKHYRVMFVTKDDTMISPSEASDVIFTSSVEARSLDLVYRLAKPAVLAKTRRSGSNFLIDFQLGQPLRAKTADDDDLSLILATVSARGSLSSVELASNRMKLSAVYAPRVDESSFTLRVRGLSSLKDPDSLNAVNPEFVLESTVTFFVGIDGLQRNNISNVLGGTLLIEGDNGRVTLPKGVFAVDASSTVEVLLQKSADLLATGSQPSQLKAVEANIRALRFAPSAYPSDLFQAMASKPPEVSPLSAFYDVLLPLGVRTALAQPAQMTISYSTSADPQSLNLYWYNPAANAYILQQDVTGAVPVIDRANHTITLSVNHFSTFVLFNTGVAVISGAGFTGKDIEAFNFPNPFDLTVKSVTPSHGVAAQSLRGTMVRFALPVDVSGEGSLRIFNVAGEKVRSISLGTLTGGSYFYQPWDGRNDSGRDVASGVYIGQIKVGSRSTFFKMAVVK